MDVAAGVMAASGTSLYPWQTTALELACGRDGTRYTAPQVALIVSRQNGKTELSVARVLAELLAGGKVLHTSQNTAVTRATFQRMLDVVDAVPALRRRVRKVTRAIAREELHLGGGVYRVVAATGRAPRGFDAITLLVLDEAREQRTADAWNALTPTQLAAPWRQAWLLSNAGSAESELLNTYRDRGRAAAQAGTLDGLAWLEWSAPPGMPADDPAGWVQANPALGHGNLDWDGLRQQHAGLSEAAFRTEHLCQWVDTYATAIDADAWRAAGDPGQDPPPAGARVAYGFAAAQDSTDAAVVAAWITGATTRVEVVAAGPGTAWLRDRVATLDGPVGYNGAGATDDLAALIAARGHRLTEVKLGEYAAACAMLTRGLEDGSIAHRPDPVLDAAVLRAAYRQVGDRQVWARRSSNGSIAALEAATVALWLARTGREPVLV